MKKKSWCLLISLIIGVIVLFCGIDCMNETIITPIENSVDSAEVIGAGIVGVLFYPFLLMQGLAVLFNMLSFFLNSRGLGITSGIFYCIATVCGLIFTWGALSISSLILSFIGAHKYKKGNK